jgi:chemotaxis protein methyltransferase CheR
LKEEASAAGLSVESFVEVLVQDSQMFQRLLNRITVQQTKFFRDAEVFAALAAHVVPHLAEPVLVWCAGCSHGQEAYSVAMLLAESGLSDWVVLGTDLSTRALERARLGVYSKAEIDGLPHERARTHFRQSRAGWEIEPELRSHVKFQHHNLSRPTMPVSPLSCQLILCRNVLIYFSTAELPRVIDRFATAMQPDGYLVLGASESLWRLTDRLRMHRVGDAFMYRLPSITVAPERRRERLAAPVERRRRETLGQLLGQGEAAAAAGDFAAAAASFRRASFLAPDHPLPYFQLALCLEQARRHEEARDAFEEARAILSRGDQSRFQADLDGFHVDELSTAIERRLRARC